jgi:hypothetical protein
VRSLGANAQAPIFHYRVFRIMMPHVVVIPARRAVATISSCCRFHLQHALYMSVSFPVAILNNASLNQTHFPPWEAAGRWSVYRFIR